MAGLIHNLENNEAVLLLYLGDELPPEDRAEVEQMLRSDSGLAETLESLRRMQAQVIAGLEHLDGPLPASDEALVRRVSRQMRRHQVELAARPAPVVRPQQRRVWPWWAYTAASIAAMIFIVLGLWGVGVIDFQPPLPGGTQLGDERTEDPEEAQMVEMLVDSLGGGSLGADEVDYLGNMPDEDTATLGRMSL
jgi:anti-sigma factor RsiW